MRAISAIFLLVLVSGMAFTQEPDSTPVPSRSTIRARVYYEETGRPVKRTSVLFMNADGGPAREASGLTDGRGMLEVKNVKAGTYYPIVNAPGAVSPLAYLDFRNERDTEAMKQQLVAFPSITVDGVTDVTGDIPVRRGGAIGGRVTYADGAPAIGVKVDIQRKAADGDFMPTIPNLSVIGMALSGGAGTLQTDDRGMYRFAGLPPGEYRVKITESATHTTSGRGYGDSLEESLFGSNSSFINVFFPDAVQPDKAEVIPIVWGQEIGEINLTIPDRDLYVLEGKIVAAKDKFPVRNAQITIERDGEPNLPTDSRKTQRLTNYTDNEGKWSFRELPKGDYILTVQSQEAILDANDRAYGPDLKTAADGSSYAATNAPSNAYYGRGNTNARPVPPPPPKFARKTTRFTIDDKSLTEESIELAFGTAITGSVAMADGGVLPTSINISFVDDENTNAGSTQLSYYDYPGNTDAKPRSKDFRVEGIGGGTFTLFVSAGDGVYVKSARSATGDLLTGSVSIDPARPLTGVQILLARDVGTLEGTVTGADKQPVVGLTVQLVPADASRRATANFSRIAITNANGEFKEILPPFEYAVVFPDPSVLKMKKAERVAALNEAVRNAPKFTIEPGGKTNASLKH